MSLTYLMQTLGTVPLFSSRAFLTAFVIAVMGRWGESIPSLGPFNASEVLKNVPDWMTSNTALMILGALAVLEVLSTKSPEARELLSKVDKYAKTAVSMAVSAALINRQTADQINQIQNAGFSLSYIWPLAIGYGVYTVAGVRNAIMDFLMEADDEDDLGVQGLLSWAEDIFSSGGYLILVLIPFLALVVFGATLLGLFCAHRYVLHLEKKSLVPCEKCGVERHPSALQCPSCKAEVEHPKRIGALGQPGSAEIADRAAHRFRLISKKRCQVCASRLPERAPQQTCPSCGSITFTDQQQLDSYLEAMSDRLMATLGICFLFGLVPVLGLIPGIIYYRLSLVASLRGYLPRIQNMFSRWMVRIINLILIAFQWVPVVGAFLLPLMCLTNYTVYRRALVRQAVKAFATSAPEPTPQP